jgi:cysteine synthase A
VVCDTSSTLAVRAAIQDRLRCHDVAGITTTSDFYVPAVAELARWLDLPGNPSDAVNRCRDKTLLRAALERDGVHQPRFAVVTDAGQAPGAVGQVGLPCVVKPADDSGSNNVLLCRTVEQAVEHVTRVLAVRTNVRGLPMARRALVEEYLDGPEYSVEMFGVDGGMDLVGITAKTVTPGPFFVETRHQFPADLPTGLALEVEASVRTALKAVGMVFGATHTEVKLTATGPAVIEINPRLAGGMIPEVIRLATGTDLVEQQVRAAAALPIDVTPHHALHAGIEFVLAQHGGVFRGVDGVPAAAAVVGVERVTVTGVSGRRVRPARNAYDRLGHVIATGGSAGDVRQALADAVAALRVHVDEPDRGADV